MNWFDIAILIVLGLFLLIGFWKGFIKTGLSLLTWGLSFALIYFFAGKLGNMIGGLGLTNALNGLFEPIFAKLGSAASYTVGTNAEGAKIVLETGELLTSALSGMMIPSILHKGLLGYIAVGGTVSGGLSLAMAAYVNMAIASVAIILVVSIVMKVVSIVLHKAMRAARVTAINRVFGAILHVCVGICFVSFVMIAIDILSPIPFMQPVIEMRNSGKIATFFTEYNPITLILNAIGKA